MTYDQAEIFAMLSGFAAVLTVVGIAVAVLMVVSMWRLFTKAGEAGWKSIIPIYNGYTLYKLTWNTAMFWLVMVIGVVSGLITYYAGNTGAMGVISSILSIVTTIIVIIGEVKLAKAYGKSGAFAVGLIFLSVIFMPILAFGDSKYVGPQ